MKQNEFFLESIKDLKQQLNADRVLIAKIHSAGIEGLAIYEFLFSIVFEDLSPDVKSVGSLIQRKPISILCKEHSSYKKNLLYVDITQWKGHDLCKSHFRQLDIECFINRYLFIDKVLAGILSFHYTERKSCPFNDFEDVLHNKSIFNKAASLCEYFLD